MCEIIESREILLLSSESLLCRLSLLFFSIMCAVKYIKCVIINFCIKCVKYVKYILQKTLIKNWSSALNFECVRMPFHLCEHSPSSFSTLISTCFNKIWVIQNELFHLSSLAPPLFFFVKSLCMYLLCSTFHPGAKRGFSSTKPQSHSIRSTSISSSYTS